MPEVGFKPEIGGETPPVTPEVTNLPTPETPPTADQSHNEMPTQPEAVTPAASSPTEPIAAPAPAKPEKSEVKLPLNPVVSLTPQEGAVDLQDRMSTVFESNLKSDE